VHQIRLSLRYRSSNCAPESPIDAATMSRAIEMKHFHLEPELTQASNLMLHEHARGRLGARRVHVGDDEDPQGG